MVTQHTLAALGEQGVRTAIYLGLTVLRGGGGGAYIKAKLMTMVPGKSLFEKR